MNIRHCFGLWYAAIVTAAVLSVGDVRAQDSASPALARIENGSVVVRQFMVPFVPLPGQERPGMPMVEPREHLLRFSVQDIQAFTLNGKPANSTDWQTVLEKETAVLFAGYRIAAPNAPAGIRDSLKLPASYQQTYRSDALVLQGTRDPVQQNPVKGLVAGFPKGPQPRFGEMWIGQDGFLHLTEKQEYKSHYYASFPAQPGAGTEGRSHIFQTNAVTVNRIIPAAEARVSALDGNLVQAAALTELQSKWTPVVVSADGSTVDPFFLQLAKPGTLVVAIPVLPQMSSTPLKAPPPR